MNYLVAKKCLSLCCVMTMELRGPGSRYEKILAISNHAKLTMAMSDTIPMSCISVQREKLYHDLSFTDGKTEAKRGHLPFVTHSQIYS